VYKKQGKMSMTLSEYFSTEPRGAKVEMALYLGITPTYMSLLIHNKRRTSPEMAISIEKATQGLVKRKDLRPDLYRVIRHKAIVV
jgi:DNA-binding transcriptional regulator YdaS (Cro superfamily)